MKALLPILRSFLAYLILSIGTFLMLRIIIDYSSMHTDIHFLKVKQDYLHIPLWVASFYTHVFSSIIALAAGFTQFSNHILQNHRRTHRIIGRIYVITILIVNFPSAMIMAIYANGLLPSKIAFTILDCLWFYFTLRAFIAARDRRIDEHKRFMIRSYALTFSAITLRSWKIVLKLTTCNRRALPPPALIRILYTRRPIPQLSQLAPITTSTGIRKKNSPV